MRLLSFAQISHVAQLALVAIIAHLAEIALVAIFETPCFLIIYHKGAFQACKNRISFSENTTRGSFAALVEEPSSATRVRHLLLVAPLEFYK